MLHVKYKIDKSDIHGVGLFTQEPIKRDAAVYTASPLPDVDITQEQFDSLDEKEKREIRYWGFWDEPNNVWHVDFDNSKFINHSLNATLTQNPDHLEAHLVATRDIERGEELTQNYLDFETEEDLKKRGIKINST